MRRMIAMLLRMFLVNITIPLCVLKIVLNYDARYMIFAFYAYGFSIAVQDEYGFPRLFGICVLYFIEVFFF